MSRVLFLSPCYRWSHWGSGSLGNLPKVTQVRLEEGRGNLSLCFLNQVHEGSLWTPFSHSFPQHSLTGCDWCQQGEQEVPQPSRAALCVGGRLWPIPLYQFFPIFHSNILATRWMAKLPSLLCNSVWPHDYILANRMQAKVKSDINLSLKGLSLWSPDLCPPSTPLAGGGWHGNSHLELMCWRWWLFPTSLDCFLREEWNSR